MAKSIFILSFITLLIILLVVTIFIHYKEIQEYLKDNKGKLDYIHGDETTRNMGREEGNVAILLG